MLHLLFHFPPFCHHPLEFGMSMVSLKNGTPLNHDLLHIRNTSFFIGTSKILLLWKQYARNKIVSLEEASSLYQVVRSTSITHSPFNGNEKENQIYEKNLCPNALAIRLSLFVRKKRRRKQPDIQLLFPFLITRLMTSGSKGFYKVVFDQKHIASSRILWIVEINLIW